MTFASSWPIMRMKRANYEGISTDCSPRATDRQGTRRFPGCLLRARLLLREELERIEEAPVGHHLVVEVGAGGAAGAAKAREHLGALDVIAAGRGERRQGAV